MFGGVGYTKTVFCFYESFGTPHPRLSCDQIGGGVYLIFGGRVYPYRCWPLGRVYLVLAGGCWRVSRGCSLLIAGASLLADPCWRLGTGEWLLVAGDVRLLLSSDGGRLAVAS